MRRVSRLESILLGASLLLLSAPSEAATLRGGFWSTVPPFESTLVLNNPRAVEEDLQLTLYSRSGARLVERTFQLGPSESKRLPISKLVSYPASGSLELHFPEDLLLPAQVQVSAGESLWFHELIDERLLGEGVERFVGLLPSLVADGKPQARLILTNVGRRATRGEIVLRAQGKEQRTPFAVGPNHVRQVDLPADELAGSDLAEVSVVLQGTGSSLLVSGYLGLAENLLPLRFEPRVRSGSRAAPSKPVTTFFSGGKPLLLLSNPHPRSMSATLTATIEGGAPVEHQVTIPPNGLEVLPVHKTVGLPHGVPGVITVAADPESRPVAQVLETDPRPLLSLMKPPAGSTSLAYSFPLQLGAEEETLVDLYNPGPEALELLLVLHFGDAIFQYPLPSPLDGGRFLSVNLSEARRVGLKDANGAVIPKDATTGQAMVMVHPDADEGRFLARVRLTRLQPSGTSGDLALGDFALLESCVICPDAVVGMQVFPDPIQGSVGTQTQIQVLLTLETGFQGASTADRAFTADPFVADVFGSPALLSFVAPGTTSIEAEKDACLLYVVEPIGPFESGCACGFRGTFFDSATVQSFSSPTITSINPPRGLIGQEHTVTITGSAFGSAPQVNVSGAGVTAQIVSSSDTQIKVKLRVRSDATVGNHGITVTNPAGTSNRRDFFVQVPGRFTFVSVAPIAKSELMCDPTRHPGFTAEARLQVVDQQGIPIRSIAMVPEESVTVQPDVPTPTPFLPFATPNNTNQNGILLDTPLGTCFFIEPRVDVCAIVTQRFQVVVTPGSGLGSERTFPISTQAVRADCGFGMDYSLEEGGVTVARVQMGTLPL